MCRPDGGAGVESALHDSALAMWGRDFTRSLLSQIWPFDGDFSTEQMAPSCRLHVRQAPHSHNNCCPSSPHSEATHLTLTPYICGASQVVTPPRETKGVSLCTGPLRWCLCFQLATVSPRWADRILADFHFQILWELFFLAQHPWAGELGMRLGHTFLFWRRPPPVRCLCRCSASICEFGVNPFRISNPPSSLNVASFYILSYRGSVHLVFR